jgi:hypothetical protein
MIFDKFAVRPLESMLVAFDFAPLLSKGLAAMLL